MSRRWTACHPSLSVILSCPSAFGGLAGNLLCLQTGKIHIHKHVVYWWMQNFDRKLRALHRTRTEVLVENMWPTVVIGLSEALIKILINYKLMQLNLVKIIGPLLFHYNIEFYGTRSLRWRKELHLYGAISICFLGIHNFYCYYLKILPIKRDRI